MLLLFLLLVPEFGAMAYVLIAFILSPIIADFLFIREISRMFIVKLRLNKFARLIIANVIASAVASLMYLFFGGVILLISAAVIYALLYPIAAVLLNGADRGDINTLRELSQSIPFVGQILTVFMDYALVVIK